MVREQTIQIFEDKKVRAIKDNEQRKWYFSVVDACGVVPEQPDYDLAKNYWKVLKHRLVKGGDWYLQRMERSTRPMSQISRHSLA